MAATDLLRLRQLVEPLEGVLADRVEHAEAAAGPAPDEALDDERLQRVEVCATHGLRRIQREAPGEDREPPEVFLLNPFEQLVAPLDGRVQRSLPRRRVA